MRITLVFAAAAALAGGGPATAAEMSGIVSIKEIEWGPSPPSLPPGGKMAAMTGDPASEGFVSLRFWAPKGYKIAPHFHPTDEHVTILSGAMAFGMGDTLNESAAITYRAGGYFVAHKDMHHYAIAKKDTVVQIDFVGPFGITYVNPADDPRGVDQQTP